MSILSGFKSFERYLKTDDGYQLASERTLAKDVLLGDDGSGNDVETELNDINSDITTINTELAKKLPLAGGTMTGTIFTQALKPDKTGARDVGNPSQAYNNMYSRYFKAIDTTNNAEVGSLRSNTIGTTETTGECQLRAGNNTPKGTAGNAKGILIVYGVNTGYTMIVDSRESTENVSVSLPKKSGWLASYNEYTGTLSAGSTSITLSGSSITTDSTVEVFTDTYGVNPTDISVDTGSVTLTFDEQESDIGVKIRIS